MNWLELLKTVLAGERDGVMLWKIPLGEIASDWAPDPSESLAVAALAENILRCGLLQPILIRKNEGAAGPPYRLIAGRRRLEAIRLLGRSHIDAILLSADRTRARMLALSENLSRQTPDGWQIAPELTKLAADGYSAGRLGALYAMPAADVDSLIALGSLLPGEIARLRAAEPDYRKAAELARLPHRQRISALACMESPADQPPTEEIEPVQKSKCAISDARLFCNSVERLLATMGQAGYALDFRRHEAEGYYRFDIRIAKHPGDRLPPPESDVSRETLLVPEKPRFSSALNIFAALAEEEADLSGYVSRETFPESLTISAENAEKLDLCIDGAKNK